MTPKYIMLKSLCRPAHCYRAYEADKGYTNEGPNADYDRQRRRSAESEIDNLGWAPKYAESGYDQPKVGVLTANWNVFPGELPDVLERAGYSIEWSDEWTTCGDCGGALRTSPDCFDWEPSYTEVEGDILCLECAPSEGEDNE